MIEQATLEIVPHGSPRYWETVELRLKVLRKPLGLDFSPEELEQEASSIHLAATYSDGVAACLVLVPKPRGEMKMRQVAVAPREQSRGLGTWLVREAEWICLERKAAKITLHARETAVLFYEKLRYETKGEPFVEVGVPHQFMFKNLRKARSSFLAAIRRFRRWTTTHEPDEWTDEWTDYPHWQKLYKLTEEFLDSYPFQDWSEGDTKELVYLLCRDIYFGSILRDIEKSHPQLLFPLACIAKELNEERAMGQLAMAVGRQKPVSDEALQFLWALHAYEDDLIHRQALWALTFAGVPEAESLAIHEWNEPEPNQEYRRAMALDCLYHLKSPNLIPFLEDACNDEREYLKSWARQLKSRITKV